MNQLTGKPINKPKSENFQVIDSNYNNLPLQDLQLEFKQYLMSHSGQIDSHIHSTEDLSNEFRLAIYANAYCMRLVETLQKDFPAIFYLLGEEAFTKIALAYIKAHPSQHPSLRFFGQYFIDFIAQDEDAKALPYLSELATLEWMLVEAFDAKNASLIKENDVANVPPEAWPTLKFRFHSSVNCFTYHWNIIPMWQAEQTKQVPPQAEQLGTEEVCLVWRHKLATRYRTLAPEEALVLKSMLEGANFGDMCESLMVVFKPEEVAMKAAGLLKSWINSGLISDLSW